MSTSTAAAGTPTTRTRRLARRRISIALMAVLGVLVLSGCMNLSLVATLNEEAKATGTMKVEIRKQLLSVTGITNLDEFKKQMEQESSDGIEGVTPEYSETDDNFVISFPLENTPLKSGDGSLSATSDGTNVTLTFKNNEQSDSSAAGNPFGDAASGGKVHLEITFPGQVTSAEGPGMQQPNDTTVIWDFPLTETKAATATSTIEPGGGSSSVALFVALGLLGLLVLAIILFFVFRKRGAGDASDGDFPPPAVPPTDPAAPEVGLGTETAVLDPTTDTTVLDQPPGEGTTEMPPLVDSQDAPPPVVAPDADAPRTDAPPPVTPDAPPAPGLDDGDPKGPPATG